MLELPGRSWFADTPIGPGDHRVTATTGKSSRSGSLTQSFHTAGVEPQEMSGSELESLRKIGVTAGTRTLDLLVMSQERYHLRHRDTEN